MGIPRTVSLGSLPPSPPDPSRPRWFDVCFGSNCEGLDAGDIVQAGGEIFTHVWIRTDGQIYWEMTFPFARVTDETIMDKRKVLSVRVWCTELEEARLRWTLDHMRKEHGNYSLALIAWHGLNRFFRVNVPWLFKNYVCSAAAAYASQESVGLPKADPKRYGPSELFVFWAELCSKTRGMRCAIWQEVGEDGLIYTSNHLPGRYPADLFA